MPLKVFPCTPRDMHDFARVESEAFRAAPFSLVLFPNTSSSGGLESRAQNLVKQMDEDPTARWFKVVDPDGPDPAKGIAFGLWNNYVNGVLPPRRQVGPFSSGCNVPACELVFGDLAEAREWIIGGKECVYLHICVTDPAHQRRGAGVLLCQAAIDDAMKHNVPVYLESTDAGHLLYKKCGFDDTELREIDLSEWQTGSVSRTWVMMYKNSGK